MSYYVAVRRPGNRWKIVRAADTEAEARKRFDTILLEGEIEVKVIMETSPDLPAPRLIDAIGAHSMSDTTWRRDTDVF